MTEAEWLAHDDPGLMVEVVQRWASVRKLRLFAVACARRMWHLLTDERSRQVVEVTEQLAEGLASPQAFQAALEAAAQVDEDDGSAEQTPATAAYLIAWYPPIDAVHTSGSIAVIMDQAAMQSQPDWWSRHETEGEEESKHQAVLFRDIFRNPFRALATVDPAWRKWNDAAIPRLAQQMYDSRDFASMPILADALEEAGCTNADILEHCRAREPHVRGCWVVDLILRKE